MFRAAMCPSSGELLYQCDTWFTSLCVDGRLVCRSICSCIPDGQTVSWKAKRCLFPLNSKYWDSFGHKTDCPEDYLGFQHSRWMPGKHFATGMTFPLRFLQVEPTTHVLHSTSEALPLSSNAAWISQFFTTKWLWLIMWKCLGVNTDIQGVSGGIVNILGGGSMNYSQ